MSRSPDRKGGLVYSSEQGRMCRLCGRKQKDCVCRKSPRGARPEGDGVVRIRRESKGRRGKTVTTISGVLLGADALRELAGDLKRRCGTGGSARDGVIEIQGDHRDTLAEDLRARGYTVKLAGA